MGHLPDMAIPCKWPGQFCKFKTIACWLLGMKEGKLAFEGDIFLKGDFFLRCHLSVDYAKATAI